MNMPAGTRFLGGCHPPPPRQGRKCGSHTCGPLSRLVDYTQEGSTTAVPGFQARRQGPEPIPGTYEPINCKPCALQHSPEMTPYWAFRPSPMGKAQNCCRGLRARTETSTYPGRCVCAPTPAPILRPQDHCKSAQVWPTQRAGGRRRMGKPHSSNPRNT